MSLDQFFDDELRLKNRLPLAALGNGGIKKEFLNLRDDPGRLIERLHELRPLFFVQNEVGLIGERFLGFLASTLDNEVSNVEPSDLGRNPDEVVLFGGCPEVKPLRLGFLIGRDAHN